MNTNLNLSDREIDRLSRKWLRAWMTAGSPNMTAHGQNYHWPALTKTPAQMCGITNSADFKKSDSKIIVECCGRDGVRGKTFLVRVALDFTTITHIVAPLAGLTMNVGGTANIDCPHGLRGVTRAMLDRMERMHIEVAVRYCSRDALRGMSGPEIDGALARIEEAELRLAIRAQEARSRQTFSGRL
jgi:hypothetical protein